MTRVRVLNTNHRDQHGCQSKILYVFVCKGEDKRKLGYIRFFQSGNKVSRSSNSRFNNTKYLYSLTWEKTVTGLLEFQQLLEFLKRKCNRCVLVFLYSPYGSCIRDNHCSCNHFSNEAAVRKDFKLVHLKPLNPAGHFKNMDITQIVFTVSITHQITNQFPN